MADITLDQTPVKTSIDDSAIIAIAEGTKLKNITQGNFLTPLRGLINSKASNTALTDGLALKINIADRGQPNGIGTLNSSGKQTGAQISDLVERIANKVSNISSPNSTDYPTTEAVQKAVLLGVNGAYQGTATLEMDGVDAPIKSFWTAIIPGDYTLLGVTLPQGEFGFISKIGEGQFEIASTPFPITNFESKPDELIGNNMVHDSRIHGARVTWVMVGDFTKRTGFIQDDGDVITFTDGTELAEGETIIINIEY